MKKNRNFTGYKVNFSPTARKEFKNLEKKYAQKIRDKINSLLDNALNLDIKKLEGVTSDLFIDVEIMEYFMKFKKLVRLYYIISISHRKDIYEGLKLILMLFVKIIS